MDDSDLTDYYVKNEYQKILTQLKETNTTSNHEKTKETLVKQISLFQNFVTTNKTTFYVLWDQTKCLPIYVSNNITYLGYSPQDLYDMDLLTAMKRIYWKQIPSINKLHKNGVFFRKLTKYSTARNQYCFYCGMKLKDRWGNVKVFMTRQKFLTFDKKGRPLLSFMTVEDITSIYKGEAGWCQYIDYSTAIPIRRVFFSNGTKAAQLLSNREFDILRLIVKNKDSATIAVELNISIETVKKHRKNMIAKVGAKDTTALIYICQRANVI